jgi:serine/threonine protein kinase
MPADINVLLQLSEGLAHIHELNLIHRDIKPENVLIWVHPTTDEVLMKWADFGLTKAVDEYGCHSVSTDIATENWYAPEILKRMQEVEKSGENATNLQKGTNKSDIFTEGLVFGYYLLHGRHLFGTNSFVKKNIIDNKPVNLKSKISIYTLYIHQTVITF